MREAKIKSKLFNENYLGFYYKEEYTFRGLMFESYLLITGMAIGRDQEGEVKHIVINPDEKTEVLVVVQYADTITVAWKA